MGGGMNNMSGGMGGGMGGAMGVGGGGKAITAPRSDSRYAYLLSPPNLFFVSGCFPLGKL